MPDDGGAVQRGARLPDRGRVHADAAGLPVGHFGDARHVHDDACRVPRLVRLGHVRRVVPLQEFGCLRANLRQLAAERLRSAVRQLFTDGQQNVLRHRSGERQEQPLHRRRVPQPHRHLQLHQGHVRQHHRRLRVRLQGSVRASQVFGAER